LPVFAKKAAYTIRYEQSPHDSVLNVVMPIEKFLHIKLTHVLSYTSNFLDNVLGTIEHREVQNCHTTSSSTIVDILISAGARIDDEHQEELQLNQSLYHRRFWPQR
jgi:hypothetical protein